MRRSVEVLGFHKEQREVRILLGLYVENRFQSGHENFLGMMHRGNVECFVRPAWPFPEHPDEHAAKSDGRLGGNVDGVLAQVYGQNFQERDGKIYQVNTMTAWDNYVPILNAEQPIRWSPFSDYGPGEWGLPWSPDVEAPPLDQWVPFTTWTLGPFTEAASYLITVMLRISGQTYSTLVAREPEFTVDGPERLLSRINYEDLICLRDHERSPWKKRLAPFENSHLLLGEGYDVIVLHSPLADKVQSLGGGIGITPAPRQPSTGDRYVTANQAFCMTLRYSAMPIQYAPSEAVLHR